MSKLAITTILTTSSSTHERPVTPRSRWCSFALLTCMAAGCAMDAGDDSSHDSEEPVGTVTQTLAQTSMTGEIAAAVVREIPVSLRAGVTVVFQTTALTPGADPVLNLLSPAGVEVAADDNGAGSGKNALIVYTPPTAGTYRLVVRAATSAGGGTCSIARNGVPTWTGVAFSGGSTLMLSLRDKETLETVRLPNGATGSHAIYVLKRDSIGIERRSVAGGTAGGALVTISTPFSSFLGSRRVVYAVRSGTGGPIGWVRNDAAIAGHDTDKDGLGNELEAAIGTCSTPTGTVTGPDGQSFDCALTADPRDTDGDGISDAWELVGRRDVAPHQPLPLWGANPRHKDIFLEVDFMRRCDNEAAMDLTMEASRALWMAAIYADQIESLPPLLRLANAVSLRNPDRLPGINLHIDTGRNPEQPAHATIYGNWGGHNAVPRAGSGLPCMGQTAASVWTTQMSAARRGIFHYALSYGGGGGSNEEYRIYSSWGHDSFVNPAHELGHSLGFGHSGRTGNNGDPDPNCKPSYPSIMNYAYYDSSPATNVAFSGGLGRPPINNLMMKERDFTSDQRYLAHLRDVFQLNVDMENGHVDWNRDGVFSSGTVQAYANFRPGGQGCEWTRYNSVRVDSAAGMNTPALEHLGNRTYVFYTDSATGQLARAYTTRAGSMATNLACPNVGDCAGVTFTAPAIGPLDASNGLDAVRLRVNGQNLLLVVVNDASGRLWETRLSVVNGVEQWTTPVRIGVTLAAGEPSLTADGQAWAYVAFKGLDGRIRTRRWSVNGWEGERVAQTRDGVPVGQPPQDLPMMAATASPGLAFSYMPRIVGRHVFGAFADATGTVDLWRLDVADGLWQKTNVMPNRPVVVGKPSMAWVPQSRTAEFPGTFYLAYLGSNNQPNFQRSFTKLVDGIATAQVGLDSPFDNNTTRVGSLALSFDPTVDINLRAVGIKGGTNVIVQPNADGITGYPQRNVNDWDWLSVTTCRTLIYPTNARGSTPDPVLTNPIKCRPFVYTPN